MPLLIAGPGDKNRDSRIKTDFLKLEEWHKIENDRVLKDIL
jgi:hypothetical protein